jgi:surface antigen
MISGIEIFGDAWTWWQKAAGKYAQGFTPKAGAVLVFKPNGVMDKGHVAVVSQVLTDRVIQVTQANWSIIQGRRGQVERDVTVIDVSPQGDWSQVKVWYDPVRDLGKTVYPTYGFIYQTTQTAAASAAETAVRTVAQTAMNQLAAAVPTPGANPAQTLTQAAGSSTDRIAALLQAATSSDGR